MQRSKIGMLLAAAAAYGAYRYSRLTPTEKTGLQNRGRDFVNKNLGGLNNIFKKKTTTTNGTSY